MTGASGSPRGLRDALLSSATPPGESPRLPSRKSRERGGGGGGRRCPVVLPDGRGSSGMGGTEAPALSSEGPRTPGGEGLNSSCLQGGKTKKGEAGRGTGCMTLGRHITPLGLHVLIHKIGIIITVTAQGHSMRAEGGQCLPGLSPNPSVNHGLWVTVMCQSRFMDGTKGPVW